MLLVQNKDRKKRSFSIICTLSREEIFMACIRWNNTEIVRLSVYNNRLEFSHTLVFERFVLSCKIQRILTK